MEGIDASRPALRILWEFCVKQDRTREFEEHYGANGTWARFFRRAQGYRETILLRDHEVPGRYLTIDVWDDLESYDIFAAANAEEYREIDRRCETLTVQERRLGSFEAL